jgi:hypothetical protein
MFWYLVGAIIVAFLMGDMVSLRVCVAVLAGLAIVEITSWFMEGDIWPSS